MASKEEILNAAHLAKKRLANINIRLTWPISKTLECTPSGSSTTPAVGDQSHTMEFEEWFREFGPYHLEAWYEVVFWKMYSQDGAASHRSQTVIDNIKASGVSAGELWDLCHDYVQNSTPENFSRFRCKLVKTDRVATAATFPAFMCPEQFPMVDTRIAAWSQSNGTMHRLLSAPRGAEKGVFERHWDFVKAWIKWCRLKAAVLTQRISAHWRARDVEMTVFTVQGSGLPFKPTKVEP